MRETIYTACSISSVYTQSSISSVYTQPVIFLILDALKDRQNSALQRYAYGERVVVNVFLHLIRSTLSDY